MDKSYTALAILVDPSVLLEVHENWPSEMHVAVTMLQDGRCDLISFRTEERGQIPARLCRMYGVVPSDFCIVPKMPGFPTRDLRTADFKTVLSLIRDMPSLVESAEDYSANFTFALEEGLEPEKVLGFDSPANVSTASEMVTTEDEGETSYAAEKVPGVTTSVPTFLRREHSVSEKPVERRPAMERAEAGQADATVTVPEFLTRRRDILVRPVNDHACRRRAAGEEADDTVSIPRFSTRRHNRAIRSVDTGAIDPPPETKVSIEVASGNWLLVRPANIHTEQMVTIREKSQVFLRSDHTAIAIDMGALDREDMPQWPYNIRLKVPDLPDGLAELPVKRSLRGSLTEKNGLLFITLSTARGSHVIEVMFRSRNRRHNNPVRNNVSGARFSSL